MLLDVIMSEHDSPIRDQSACDKGAPKIIVQDVKVQIHISVLRHEIRDAPDRSAPFHPGDPVAPVRVQVETDRRRRRPEPARFHGRVGGGGVQVHVVGGLEEAEQHVGEGNPVTEFLEFDLEGGVRDGVDVWLWWEGAGGGLILSAVD